MALAIVDTVKTCCSSCGALFSVNAHDYIANAQDVEPSFIVGVGYEAACPECEATNSFELPTTMLKKVNVLTRN